MQEKYININTLKVSEKLSQFISDELLKETDLSCLLYTSDAADDP